MRRKKEDFIIGDEHYSNSSPEQPSSQTFINYDHCYLVFKPLSNAVKILIVITIFK
jgi:hypothetical protein